MTGNPKKTVATNGYTGLRRLFVPFGLDEYRPRKFATHSSFRPPIPSD